MTRGQRKLLTWALMAAALCAILVLLWSLLPLQRWLLVAMEIVSAHGWVSVPIFIVVYVVLASSAFPSTPLNLAAGMMFGYWLALVAAFSASALAAIATFLIARHVATDWIRARVDAHADARALLGLVNEEGFKMVLLTRLNPFIPAVVKGYGFGITDISLSRYLLATLLGQLPIVAAHVYLGWAGGLAMMDGDARPEGWQFTLVAGGALVSVVLLIVISWYGHRHLARGGPRRSLSGGLSDLGRISDRLPG